MKEVNVIGIDLAKNVFQVYATNKAGQRVVNRRLKRSQLRPYIARFAPCLIGLEACSTSHYWAREFIALGHQVKLMNPRFVKPYVKGNKNDANDAEAICEAVQRPSMRFVELKTPAQQAVLHLHKSRQLLIKERIAMSNHIRAVLAEFGIVMPPGVRPFERRVPDLLADDSGALPALSRRTLQVLWTAYQHHRDHMAELENELAQWHRGNEASQRLADIPGIGLQTATALVAKLGSAQSFRNGREVAAFLGLVPQQASSGARERLLGISKRGDGYLRRLLVQGAQSVIRQVKRRQAAGLPGGHPWVESLLARHHPNKVAIALANKMARMAWVVLAQSTHYCRFKALPLNG